MRKSGYVPEKGVDYDPDRNHTSTVYAGTMVQQVCSLYSFDFGLRPGPGFATNCFLRLVSAQLAVAWFEVEM